MIQSLKDKPNPNLTFVNLKTFISGYFERELYVLSVIHENYLERMKGDIFERNVALENYPLECNLRVIDTYLPELLMFLAINSSND